MSVRDEWNMACPRCGADNELDIEMTVTGRLTPDGTDCDTSASGDHTWTSESACTCQACGWEGQVKHAEIPERFSIQILWGQAPEKDAEPQNYTFNTKAELDAFLLGIAEGDGWMGYEVITEDESE